MKKLLLLITVLITEYQNITAQIPVGGWRDHLPYIQAQAVAKVGNKIYCSTPYALFYYNLNDNSIEKLSKTSGLSDIGISTISYNSDKDLLMVAYENANLDLIKGNTISNLNDIKNKSIQGNKKIYQIVFEENLAYLACGFGIVVIDVDKKEVKETYYIGPNAAAIEVYSLTFDNQNIYAATESGVYYANKNNNNLSDFNQWQNDEALDFPDAKYNSIINFNSQILACYVNQTEDTSIIFRKNELDWTAVYNPETLIKQLNQTNSSLYVIENGLVKILNSNFTESRTISSYPWGTPNPSNAFSDEQGIIYIADESSGLVICRSSSEFQSIVPNSPYTNHVSDIDIQNNVVWVAGGGRNVYWDNLYRIPELYSFVEENWRSNILWSSSAKDFMNVLVNPYNPTQVFVGSWGWGVFVFENNEHVNTYNETNSTLQSVLTGENYIRIGGMVLDEDQNLYVTNTGVSSPISVKTNSGEWYSYNYQGISGYADIGEIINTQYNHKWIQLARGGGLFAFNDNYTPNNLDDDQYRKFSIFDENGDVVTNEVLSIAEDNEGIIWVGTDQGVFTYYNPQNVFSGNNFYAERIKVTDSQNDTVVQYLLAKERVSAIAIDGANRKWFGTESSGLFLLSADCQKEIFHFTTKNSKLISNFINTIAIDGKTGEVFIGTNLGVVSFKSTATKGNESFKGAYVYPNPVRENYTGPITITGLASNVNVKITDISGQLVYETNAFGGQAIWDGKNYTGRKVNTGVYLVFCTDEEGKSRKVLKLLVIN